MLCAFWVPNLYPLAASGPSSLLGVAGPSFPRPGLDFAFAEIGGVSITLCCNSLVSPAQYWEIAGSLNPKLQCFAASFGMVQWFEICHSRAACQTVCQA